MSLTKESQGLEWGIIKEGSGAAVTANDSITVNYAGWLTNGTLFDSSWNAGRTPFVFTPAQNMVIQGWVDGVIGMKVGEIRELVIPAALGYGAQGSGSVIPPNATLIFQVQLVSIG